MVNVSESVGGNYVDLSLGVGEVATISEKTVPHILETWVVRDGVPKAVEGDSLVEESVDDRSVGGNVSGENRKPIYLYGRLAVPTELCGNIF